MTEPVLQELAALVGAGLGTMPDEHRRWAVYQRAMASEGGPELLFRAVLVEPNAPLATTVVLHMLERLPDDAHEAWVGQLPEGRSTRDYARQRAAEVAVLRRARAGALTVDELTAGLDGWTDWLQRRLATVLTGDDALAVLAAAGRTRRVRTAAAERISLPRA